jgi:hypothetical protein
MAVDPAYHVNWNIDGGFISEFDWGNDNIEVNWVDNNSVGTVDAVVSDTATNSTFSNTLLVAINSKLAPDKAQVVRVDSVFFCSIDDASYYQWKKNGIAVDKDEARKSWFYDTDYNSNDSIWYTVLVSDCEDCNSQFDCITESFRILNTETECEGCSGVPQFDVSNEITFTATSGIVDLVLDTFDKTTIKVTLTDETDNTSYILTTSVTQASHTMRLKNLTEGHNYSVILE